MSEHQKGLLSYYQRKQKKSDQIFANLVTGKSKFTKKSFRKSSAETLTSAATTSAAAAETEITAVTATTTPTTQPIIIIPTRPTTPPNREETTLSSSPARKKRRTTTGVEEIEEYSDDDFPFTRKELTTSPNVEEAIASLSSPARKKRRTTTGVEEIEHSDDDAPLTRKDGKVFLTKFEKLEKQISDLRKMMETNEMITASDYTHREDFINDLVLKIANVVIKKKIYTTRKYLKKVAAKYAFNEYPEYFGEWDDTQWSFYFGKYIYSKLLAKHRSLRGSIASRVRSSIFAVYGERLLPPINTKSPPGAIKAWKESQQVKDAYRKLNEKRHDSELTWSGRIVQKTWPNVKKISKEKLAFAISICQFLLNPKNGSIKINDEVVRILVEKNKAKIDRGEDFEFEEESFDEGIDEEEEEEDSSPTMSETSEGESNSEEEDKRKKGKGKGKEREIVEEFSREISEEEVISEGYSIGNS